MNGQKSQRTLYNYITDVVEQVLAVFIPFLHARTHTVGKSRPASHTEDDAMGEKGLLFYLFIYLSSFFPYFLKVPPTNSSTVLFAIYCTLAYTLL